MNRKPTSASHADLALSPDGTPSRIEALQSEPHPPKRGFKPRWLRLQRRERKFREARALALLRSTMG